MTSSRRRRRMGSAAAAGAADLSALTGTILGQWDVANVVGPTPDTKFTNWPDATANGYDLATALNGGLTYRAAASGFGGVLAAADVVASTDGLYRADASFPNTAQPYAIIGFGKFDSPANTKSALGNGSYSLGVFFNVVMAYASGAISTGAIGADSTVRVYTLVVDGASSRIYYNDTVKVTGNSGAGGFGGSFAVGAADDISGALSWWNEVVFVSGSVSAAEVSDVVVPYFRDKSGLALA